VTYKLQAIKC